MSNEQITLELMNPRGEVEQPPVYSPSPRLPDLNGKKIGMYSNSKHGVDNFFTALETLLRSKFEGIATTRLAGAFEIRDNETGNFVSGIDAFIYAIGD
ncbi:MAG: hypothetical protein JW712_13825 [Dehalococcoidales bacterium]|nr:hypothetical protein [Dehalococcoidales bacterium]